MPSAIPTAPRAAARVILWGAIAALLLLPAIAMLFTADAAWGAEDFAAAALLLIGGGFAWEVAARRIATRRGRIIAALAIIAAVVLVWAELAVGIFR